MSRTRVPIWCEIVCEVCFSKTAGRTVIGAIPREVMTAEARYSGWIFERNKAFCTKDCAERSKGRIL